MREWFRRFAEAVAKAMGSPTAFWASLFGIAVGLSFGPRFHWSDSFQMVFSNAVSIVTFLVTLLILNATNRKERARDLQAAELIRATPAARDELIDLSTLTDEEFATLERQMKACVRTKPDDVLEAIEEGLRHADE